MTPNSTETTETYVHTLSEAEAKQALIHAIEAVRQLRICDLGGYNRRSAREISADAAAAYETTGREGLRQSVGEGADNVLLKAGIVPRNSTQSKDV